MILAKFLKNKNSQRIVALLLLKHNARLFLPRYYAHYAGILWTNLVLVTKDILMLAVSIRTPPNYW